MVKLNDEKAFLKAAQRVAEINNQLVEAEAQYQECWKMERDRLPYGILRARRDALLLDIREYEQNYNPDQPDEWMVMPSGKRFWPYGPRAKDIDIEDIAHCLSMLCRFSGATTEFYSVAHHSVLVSRVVCAEAALAGLLHDASEAYLGDIIRPLKRNLTFYRQTEDKVMAAICERFGLDDHDSSLWKEVKRGDHVLLSTEFRDVARCGARITVPEEPPMKEKIRPLGPAASKRLFLARFKELTSEVQGVR